MKRMFALVKHRMDADEERFVACLTLRDLAPLTTVHDSVVKRLTLELAGDLPAEERRARELYVTLAGLAMRELTGVVNAASFGLDILPMHELAAAARRAA